MSPHDRLVASATLYEEDAITNDEFVQLFMQEILDGNLTSLEESPIQPPKELADDFQAVINRLEANKFVDVYPFQRETIESRQNKAERFKDLYIQMFAEIRAYFKQLDAG